MVAPPGQAAHVIGIPGPVKFSIPPVTPHMAAEKRIVRVKLRSAHQVGQPIRLRKSIGIQKTYPFAIGGFMDGKVVGGGKADISFETDPIYIGEA